MFQRITRYFDKQIGKESIITETKEDIRPSNIISNYHNKADSISDNTRNYRNRNQSISIQTRNRIIIINITKNLKEETTIHKTSGK